MPPAISDDEKSDVGIGSDLSVKKNDSEKKPVVTTKEVGPEDYEMAEPMAENGYGDEEDEEDDDDLEEDEYVVEKILSHYIADDTMPRFEVKWEGFDDKADRTWEPEENLRENASEILDEYFRKIGGRERLFDDTNKALTGKKRGRQSNSATPNAGVKRSRKNGAHPSDSTPPASTKAVEWKPPSGSWDEQIEAVDMCQDEDNGDFIIYLTWKNGRKTQHTKEVVYRRCPQKMLRYYERHIRVTRDGESVPISSF